MQNLPITVCLIPPATKDMSSTANSAEHADAPGSEDFGKVLAREMSEVSTGSETTPNVTDASQVASARQSAGQDAKASNANRKDDTSAETAQADAIALTRPDLAALFPALTTVARLDGQVAGSETEVTSEKPCASGLGTKHQTVNLMDLMDRARKETNDISARGLKPELTASSELASRGEFPLPANHEPACETVGGVQSGPTLAANLAPSALVVEQNATPPTPTLRLEPRLGKPGWNDSLGQKAVWMVSQQIQMAELHLNPPDLGPMQVVLTVTNDQASAQFYSQHLEVRQAIEAALPRLREMMTESGISLGNTSVSSNASRQQPGFASHNGRNTATGISTSGTSTQTRVSQIGTGRNGLVDLFA